jgi:hypothetical protein
MSEYDNSPDPAFIGKCWEEICEILDDIERENYLANLDYEYQRDNRWSPYV